MSVNWKFPDALRSWLIAFGLISICAPHAAACDLTAERTNFTSTIEYDVFAFDRAGTTLQLRVTNASPETCRARFAIYDGSEQITPLRFSDVGLDVETTLAPGAGQSSASLQSSPILLELPGDATTDLSLDFFTDQHDAILAGDYVIDASIVLMEADSDARLIDVPGQLALSVAPRAQINIAGAAGDFGFETYSDMIYFEEPKPGDQQRFFVQSRSNTLTTMTIRSENGGKMTNPDIPATVILYDFILEGEEIDLSSPWSVPDRVQTDLKGASEEVIVRISDDNKRFFAGEYQDIVTIEITTQ